MKKVIRALKAYIISHKKICDLIYPSVLLVKKYKLYLKYASVLKQAMSTTGNKLYYIGIPAHGNLGDLAQGVCIRRWITNNFGDYIKIELETNAIVNTPFSVINKFVKAFNADMDLIVFQSGYTTTDLGGYADVMHQAIINAVPDAKILMMPQTIFFKSKEREQLCARVYSKAENMLFLARDNVSYQKALDMFENIRIKNYPDIVTTLIGKYKFNYNRTGMMVCVRDDGEKYYSDAEIDNLIARLKNVCSVDTSDTTKNGIDDIIENAEEYINQEINMFAKYKVTITDRYHGTILSLAAGTPVIIIKTTDHKVVTGADWFKGIYDGHVYVAKDLDDAYNKACELYCANIEYKLDSYFDDAYYSKLKKLFLEVEDIDNLS